jgi:hypothetical protein
MRFTLCICGLSLLTAPLAGCKQKEGEHCNVSSDCEEGLVCCVTRENQNVGGECYRQEQCDYTAADSGVPEVKEDGGAEDAEPAQEDAEPAQEDAEPAQEDVGPDPDTTPDPDTRADPDSGPDLGPDPDGLPS